MRGTTQIGGQLQAGQSHRSREAELDDVAVVGVHFDAGRRAERAPESVVAEIVSQQPVEVRDAPRVRDRGPKGLAARASRELVDPVRGRRRRRHEHEIAERRLPRLDVRKHGAERCVDRLQRTGVDLVTLYPLREDAAGGQSGASRAVILLGEQARDAGAVGIGRLRRNHVVALATGQQRLARVADRHAHFRIRHRVAVDRRARARDVQHDRLELDDVDALHRRDVREPAGGAAGAETDDERAARVGVTQRAEQSKHHLRAGVETRAAVRLAVHDERVAALLAQQRDAALDAVGIPHDRAPDRGRPLSKPVRRRHDIGRRAPGADAAVTPERGGPRRGQQRERERCDGDVRERRSHPAPPFDADGREPEQREHDGDESPRVRRREPRQQSESSSERSDDGPERVRGIREADVAADALASGTEKGDEQRELVAGDERRRQHDDRRDDRPSGDRRRKAGRSKRQQRQRQHAEPIAERKGRRHGNGLEEARRSESRQRCGTIG